MKYLIETDRLVLRDLEPRDEDRLAAMLADEEVMRWIGAGGAQGGDAAKRVIERERGHYAERGWGEWATTERDSGRMIMSPHPPMRALDHLTRRRAPVNFVTGRHPPLHRIRGDAARQYHDVHLTKVGLAYLPEEGGATVGQCSEKAIGTDGRT